ncbi:MAG: hypothetical protein LLG04_12705 [Parachlamydia sp.]|nr:hypothetical protein [Parachlamydia sp.]
MKTTHLLLAILLSLSAAVKASDSPIIEPKEVVANEIARLNLLIESTQQSLEQQRRLRDMVVEYQKIQARYMESSEDNELLYQLIKKAYAILETIKAQHLEAAFEPEFLSELSMLSKPALKSGIPKP